ncbi:MAG: hypothetical protein HPPSJP_4970 [Candidatus Hepatoplasma scabrum]|nr:MAG: hypothetical protein HPPSJP_4970 [Candidatus Hepatoplasma sp.]
MKDFTISKGFSIDLIAKDDDYKLINLGKEFIEKLEDEYKKYKDNLKKEIKKFEKYAQDENVYFSQEKLLKKSPLTILNAPWGSGKTYFIESFAKHFIDKEIKLKTFKKIIILDVWKYSNSKKIPDEIISELFSILINKTRKEKLKENLKKFSINFFINPFLVSWANYFLKAKIKEIQISKNELNKLVNDISNDIDHTLIIFDNIERIGKYSWEVIKAIFKISQIDKLCFILPMNINKLNDNDKYIEYPIEKYIDLPIFNFKQDYLSFLRNKNLNEDEAILINKILNTERNGEKLSIRKVEQRFRSLNILNINDKYEKIKFILKNIWPVYNEGDDYFKKEILEYHCFFKEKNYIFEDFKNIIFSNEDLKQNKFFKSKYESINKYLDDLILNLRSEKIDLKKDWLDIFSKIYSEINGIWKKNTLTKNNLDKEIKEKLKKLDIIEKRENELNLNDNEKILKNGEKINNIIKINFNLQELNNMINSLPIYRNKWYLSEIERLKELKNDFKKLENKNSSYTNLDIIKSWNLLNFDNMYEDEKIVRLITKNMIDNWNKQ